MGVTVSSSHPVSAAPSSSGGGLLTLCSSKGSLPWETVFHELLQRGSFPWAAVLHELLQCGSLPRGAVLQEQAAPAWVPRGVTSPASKPAAGSSLHGATGPGRSLLQRRLSMGSQPPSGIHLLWRGDPSMGCRWRSAPPWTSMHYRGTACLTIVFITSCRGISAPAPRAPPPPLSSLTSVSTGLFHIFSFLSLPAAAVAQQLFPLLKSVITEVLPLSLMGSALASSRSVLEPVALALSDMGKILMASHISHPCSPPTTKTLPCRPSTYSLDCNQHSSSIQKSCKCAFKGYVCFLHHCCYRRLWMLTAAFVSFENTINSLKHCKEHMERKK